MKGSWCTWEGLVGVGGGVGPTEVGGDSHFHSIYDGVFSVTAKSSDIEACSTAFLETRSETVTEPEFFF